ncbi:MAG: hypothetical protein EBU46_17675 [Nitrosomonadaceae bacterium]|nr:hypothetical protein [Nitrosomonadaceae bacterium]
MARSVPTEAAAVGAIMVILYAMVHMPMAGAFPKFAATGAGVYFAVFLAGVVGHLLLEAAGLNKKFCQHAYDS